MRGRENAGKSGGDLDTGAHSRAAAAKAAEDQRQAHFPRLVDGKGNAIPLTQEFLGQILGVRRTTSLKPRKNASTDGAHSLAVALPRTPITRVVACCARAERGHAAAAPPSIAKNFRRPM
jgi:hypothetical protein